MTSPLIIIIIISSFTIKTIYIYLTRSSSRYAALLLGPCGAGTLASRAGAEKSEWKFWILNLELMDDVNRRWLWLWLSKTLFHVLVAAGSGRILDSYRRPEVARTLRGQGCHKRELLRINGLRYRTYTCTPFPGAVDCFLFSIRRLLTRWRVLDWNAWSSSWPNEFGVYFFEYRD